MTSNANNPLAGDRRRWRRLWVFKWLGTVGCALLATAFVVSGWWIPSIAYLHYDKRGPSEPVPDAALTVVLNAGGIEIQEWQDISTTAPSLKPGWEFWSYAVLSPPEFECVRELDVQPARGLYMIPLWIPFAALLIPTLLCWRLDRRVPPGHCRQCRYDLTGNTSGTCPECGTRRDGTVQAK